MYSTWSGLGIIPAFRRTWAALACPWHRLAAHPLAHPLADRGLVLGRSSGRRSGNGRTWGSACQGGIRCDCTTSSIMPAPACHFLVVGQARRPRSGPRRWHARRQLAFRIRDLPGVGHVAAGHRLAVSRPIRQPGRLWFQPVATGLGGQHGVEGIGQIFLLAWRRLLGSWRLT